MFLVRICVTILIRVGNVFIVESIPNGVIQSMVGLAIIVHIKGEIFVKKVLSIVLILTLLSVVGCSNRNSSDNDYNYNYDYDYDYSEPSGLSETEAMEKAKQAVVNEICEKEYVEKISITYGTENIEKDGSSWEAELKGYYYTINSYGEYDWDKEYFSYKVNVTESGYAYCYG